jgi:hypothetical protein
VVGVLPNVGEVIIICRKVVVRRLYSAKFHKSYLETNYFGETYEQATATLVERSTSFNGCWLDVTYSLWYFGITSYDMTIFPILSCIN